MSAALRADEYEVRSSVGGLLEVIPHRRCSNAFSLSHLRVNQELVSLGLARRSRRSARSCLLSIDLRFFSPSSQRWQKEHSSPLAQPLVWKKAQGLQCPEAWLEDPWDWVGSATVASVRGQVRGGAPGGDGICAGGGGSGASCEPGKEKWLMSWGGGGQAGPQTPGGRIGCAYTSPTSEHPGGIW
mmetsp:Transcript_68362/g.180174  ORF Transcript_68362/g.180174 Transcript_68362/m.180174 type:complete len:185 (-) Transcript_68362:605-1159(-)